MPWRDWLSGQWARPTPAGSLLLRPLAALYAALVAARQALYRHGWCRAVRLPVPVVVVGNLVVGGAGKTPTVVALVDWLRGAGWSPGVVSRGYGRQGTAVRLLAPQDSAASAGDEPLLILRRCGVPVAVGADRVAAAQALLRTRPGVNILVADDGLQHLRLARDIEVIVVDAGGVGNRRCLPAGPLRAPLPAEPPAHALLLYTHGAASLAWPGHVGSRQLAGVLPWAEWRAGARPLPESWAALRGRPLVAAAGLAHPEAFFAMLRAQGLQIQPVPLPDHHAFTRPPWLTEIAAEIATEIAAGADWVVTEKDAVKLDPAGFGAGRVWVAPLDFRLPASFTEALARRLPPPPPPPTPPPPTAPR